MPAYRKGTDGYYKALEKRRATLKANGNEDFYKTAGAKGGKASNSRKGFGSNPNTKEIGIKGGKLGRRGKKLLSYDDGIAVYRNLTTNEITREVIQ